MNRLRALVCSLALLWPSLAFGQSAVLQGGGFTGGHVPIYANPSGSQPVVTDGGGAAGGGPGVGLGELNITARGTGNPPFAGKGSGPLGTVNCTQDAPTSTGNYHYLCLSANAQGGGLLTFGAAGTAPIIPFNMIVNGVPATFPFGGGSGGGATVTPPLVPGNVPIETATGIADSGVRLVTTIGAGQVWNNPTNAPGGPVATDFLRMPSGTAGTPTYSNFTDPTTGLFFPSAGVMSIAVGGKAILKLNTPGTSGNSLEMGANNSPLLRAVGTDVALTLAGAGAAGVEIMTGGASGFLWRHAVGSAGPIVNYFKSTATTSGIGNIKIEAIGGDSNVDIQIDPLGVAEVKSIRAFHSLSTTSAITPGSNTQAFIKGSSTTNLGIYYGTGDPAFSAGKGSLYTKVDATTTTTRLWVNTDGATTWAFFTSNQ